jgi:Carbohydrate family 9 binding domain-like/F5/8 type C domain
VKLIMKQIIVTVVKYVVMLSVCCSSVYAIDIPFLDKPAVIDGKMAKGEWKQAKQCGALSISNKPKQKGRLLQNKTDVYVGYNQEYLFVAFICHEKNMAKIKAAIYALEARDTNIWRDDCVEVLLDPLASGTEYYHFIINSNGIFYDALNGDNSWDSNMKVAVKKYKDQWIVEMAIPFADFGYTPSGMEQWRGNFCREQKMHYENSALFPTRAFTNPLSFGSLAFLKPGPATDNIQLTIKRRWKEDNPVVKISIKNRGKVSQKIRVAVFNTVNRKLFSRASDNIVVAPQETKEIVLPYKTSPDKQRIELIVSNLSNNSILYRNHFQLKATAKASGLSKKVWNLPDPLYEKLFSSEPLALGKEGAISWMPDLVYNKMRTIAKQFGFSYRYEDIYKPYAENKLKTITQYGVLTKPYFQRALFSKKSGMKNVVFADPRKYSKGKIPFGKQYKRPWPADPVAVNAANQIAKEALKNHRDVIWGISLGDEVEKVIYLNGIELFNKYSKAEYPYIHNADREIKNKYGYGKYGIPLDKHDTNPFRLIAYRRWANQQLVNMHAKLYDTVKEMAPEVKVIGNDAIAFHTPFNYRDIKCDISNQQLYPRRSAYRARFGFLTKLNVDLSGNKDFWPVPHVENYAGNFSHAEVLELMSQVIRNGGTGFQFWPTDHTNNLSGHNALHCEKYAAPDRWKLLMAIVKERGKMKKLKFPKPDFAILFATDSYASLPYGSETYEVESAYTFLGPVARSYFTFVDDYRVEDTPEQLSQYKVLYVPFGKYMRKKVADNILEYVKNGGILIAGDPEIFSFCSDGTSLKHISEKLFGITTKAGKRQSYIKYGKLVLPVYSKAYAINLRDKSNIKILAAYKDGTPAIIEHKYGKGKAVFFAANPFKLKGLSDKGWKTFFTLFQKKYGLKVGHDIWRFQFPKTLIPELSAPKGKCLTNNNLVWRRNKGLNLCNEDTGGNYSYSLQPDKYKEQTGIRKSYPFTKGDLTDRKQAPKAGNVNLGKGSLADWVVSWKNPAAFNLTFDFLKPKKLSKLSMFYSGQLPAISLYVSNDGKNWVDLKTTTQKQPSTKDVLEHILSGNFGSYQYLQIRFGARDKNNTFTLAEIDVWSE